MGLIDLSVLFWLRRREVESVALLASNGRRRALAVVMAGGAFVTESDAAAGELRSIFGGASDIVF